MSYSLKSLGFNKVAVLNNGKHVKTFHGASAPTDAKMHIAKLHTDNQPKPQKTGNISEVVAEMQAIQDNIDQFDESMLEEFSEEEINELIEKYEGFGKLEGELKDKGAKNPAALAAFIGRQKYGKKKFQKKAAAGHVKEAIEGVDTEGTDKWQAKEQDPKPFHDIVSRAASTITISTQKAGLYGHGPFGITQDFETKFQPNPMDGKAQLAGPNESVADKHQHKILKDTVKNPAKALLGGPSHEEAIKTLKTKFGYSDEKIKKLQNESVETLDEISKKTLGSYVKKAAHDSRIEGQLAKDFEKHATYSRSKESKEGYGELAMKHKQKAWNREDNINKAVDRLTKEDITEAELDDMISEVLSKSAEAGEWIKDFVDSKDPKFAGKSKEERKKQALAAYYAKQNEELELDEALSDEHMSAVKAFAAKHGKDWKQKLSHAWMKGTDSSEPNGHLLRQVRNQHGPSVLNKINLSESELGSEGDFKKAPKKFAKAPAQDKQGKPEGSLEVKEDLDEEMLDEISKKTLGSYVKKAQAHTTNLGAEIGKKQSAADEVDRYTNRHMPNQSDERERMRSAVGAGQEDINKVRSKAIKRTKGVAKAVDRLTKESFADFIFDGEVIHEELTYELTEADKNYEAYFKEMMKKAGINNIGELKTDDAKKEFMNSVDAGFKAKNEDHIVENMLKSDVESKIEDHKKLGHTVSPVKYSTKNDMPHAEYTVTTGTGGKKKFVYHGKTLKTVTLS